MTMRVSRTAWKGQQGIVEAHTQTGRIRVKLGHETVVVKAANLDWVDAESFYVACSNKDFSHRF